jgi:hypothetical protein
LLLLALLSGSVQAATEYQGLVNGVYVNSSGTVLLAVDNGTSRPDCKAGSWDFTFALGSQVGEAWLSLILTAKTTGKTIKVGYGPNTEAKCSVAYIYQLE